MQILIADPSDLVLVGIQTVLNQPVILARNLDEACDAIREYCPEIIICGQHLDPETNILAVTGLIRRLAPEARLLIVGSSMDGRLIREFFAEGVSGYLYQGDDLALNLPAAVQSVLQNRPYLSPTAHAEYLVTSQTDDTIWRMNDTARQVLRLVAEGVHVKEIALRMGLTKRQIYGIQRKLRRRFGAETNEHLILRAVEEGFLPRL